MAHDIIRPRPWAAKGQCRLWSESYSCKRDYSGKNEGRNNETWHPPHPILPRLQICSHLPISISSSLPAGVHSTTSTSPIASPATPGSTHAHPSRLPWSFRSQRRLFFLSHGSLTSALATCLSFSHPPSLGAPSPLGVTLLNLTSALHPNTLLVALSHHHGKLPDQRVQSRCT